MQCPKCGYVRKPGDQAPDWQCPSCGIAYAKFIARQQENAVQAAAVLEAEEMWDAAHLERLDQVARGQKMIIRGILLGIVFGLAVQPLSRLPLPSWLADAVLLLGLSIYMLIGAVKVCSGLEKGQGQKILFMVMMFFPVLGTLALLYLSQKATGMLRKEGVRVGLFGAKS